MECASSLCAHVLRSRPLLHFAASLASRKRSRPGDPALSQRDIFTPFRCPFRARRPPLDATEEALAKDLLERCRSAELIEAGKTSVRDLGELKHFVEHCRDLGVSPLPAQPGIVAKYLLEQLYKCRSERAVTKTARSIAYAHDANGFLNPCETRWVRRFFDLDDGTAPG